MSHEAVIYLPQWATENIEFIGRDLAVREMMTCPKLRRHVLRAMTDLEGVGGRLVRHDCAAECLAAIWVARHRAFHDSWNSTLPGPVFAACLGAIRNRYHNAVETATGRWEGRAEHDVRRASASVSRHSPIPQ